VAGLALAAAGLFASYYTDQRALAMGVAIAGGGLVIAAIASSGGARASRLREMPFAATDYAVMAAAVASVGAFIAARMLGFGDVSYLPFPRIHAPDFSPLLALACLLLIAPALASRRAPER
jgi:nitroreductase